MIMDAQLLPSDAQAVTTTALSTNAIDLSVGRDISRGKTLRAVAKVVTAFAGGTSIHTDLVESDNSDLSSSSTIVTGPTVVLANATLGATLLDVVVPKTSKRYLGFNHVVAGTMTAGKVTGGLVFDSESGAFLPAYTGF